MTSNVLHGLLTDKESFLSSPASAARMFYENNTGMATCIIFKIFCLFIS